MDKNINHELVSIEEMMKKFMVSKTTIFTWIRKNGLPSIKLGGTLRFDPREVEEWVNQNRRGRHKEDWKWD